LLQAQESAIVGAAIQEKIPLTNVKASTLLTTENEGTKLFFMSTMRKDKTMSPFDVLLRNVPDVGLGPLLTTLDGAGFKDPVITPIGEDGRDIQPHEKEEDPSAEGVGPVPDDLPNAWTPIRELQGQRYRWPEEEDRYLRYTIYQAETASEGSVHIALGDAERVQVFGRDRNYTIAFLTSGPPQNPLLEFLEADDFERTEEMLAIIRGRDGGASRTMFGPDDELPRVYADRFRTELFKDRVDYPRAWNKLAVVARKSEPATMLNHALLQARRRGDL
jgi:hypothetical protein